MKKHTELLAFFCLIITNLILLNRICKLEREMIDRYNLESKTQMDIGEVFSGKKQFKGRNINVVGQSGDFM